jgi:hypothetical protein
MGRFRAKGALTLPESIAAKQRDGAPSGVRGEGPRRGCVKSLPTGWPKKEAAAILMLVSDCCDLRYDRLREAGNGLVGERTAGIFHIRSDPQV